MSVHRDTPAERTIALTKEENLSFRRAFRHKDTVKRMMAEILTTITDELMEREERIWDQVAQKFGFKDHYDSEEQGFVMRLDWVTQQAQLLKTKED